jgi:1-deoxy-D-xylulose-5-phosphate reductoisomerase
MKRLVILGSTGSVGQSTVDVVRRNPGRFTIEALTAWRSVDTLLEQCVEFRPRFAAVADPDSLPALREGLAGAGLETRAAAGPEALEEAAQRPAADFVMAAIVGAAGLLPTLAAARAGKRVLLANKEAVVMSGPMLIETAARNGAELIPIDSEHNAVFQCLPPPGPGRLDGVVNITLTASGGPFLDTPARDLAEITPEQACAHPNWDMGRKISVDSATLMNKGLEVIEACCLFELPPSAVEVVVHPQSIVHSLVHYRDGSVLAQLGNPDMRTPIAHALGWPARIEAGVAALDLVGLGRLDFRRPDHERFPCLGLARAAAQQGGAAPVWLNAVNEVAVGAFLEGRVRFPSIAAIIDSVLAQCLASPPASLAEILAADREARSRAEEKMTDFLI